MSNVMTCCCPKCDEHIPTPFSNKEGIPGVKCDFCGAIALKDEQGGLPEAWESRADGLAHVCPACINLMKSPKPEKTIALPLIDGQYVKCDTPIKTPHGITNIWSYDYDDSDDKGEWTVSAFIRCEHCGDDANVVVALSECHLATIKDSESDFINFIKRYKYLKEGESADDQS